MSDEGEKVCPLCTEEMDLTDQQLNPCRCGYQICVWCWHHIMDMAEKDDAEGRCPACRTPYDKEKIVGTKPHCESRLVSEINSERKLKSQKAKSKTNEGRKQLSSVRVIQRNLVYIIGIPSDLADEEVLQHKEYFGQYGKVLKVSISRTPGGAIQHSANNTCSVYITYSKEEEAVRCIQSVHGYVLDGKSLRACFGTTKYCHAWLRNMSCSNPDCLYLHDIGTHEDSFSKDEIVSAYTRSRIPQTTGATNNLQRRAGSLLPPPCDDFCIEDITSSAKPIPKSVPNNHVTQVRVSPPNSSSGRSNILPAAASWGLRVSNGRLPTASASCSDGPAKQKSDTYNELSPSVVASSSQVSSPHLHAPKESNTTEEIQAIHSNGRLEPLESSQQYTSRDLRTAVLDAPVKVARSTTAVSATLANQVSSSTSYSSEMGIIMPPDRPTCSVTSDKDEDVGAFGTMNSLCSGLASLDMDRDSGAEHCHSIEPNSKAPSLHSFNLNGSQTTQQNYAEQYATDPLNSVSSRMASNSDGYSVSRGKNEWRLEPTSQVLSNASNKVDAILFDDWGSTISEVTHPASLLHSVNSSKAINNSDHRLLQHSDSSITRNSGYSSQGTQHMKFDTGVLSYGYSDSASSNGFVDNNVSISAAELLHPSRQSNFSLNKLEGMYSGRYSDNAVGDKYAALDSGESSIISDILSLDNDAWDESLTSPHNLAKWLGEVDKQHGSHKSSSSWKVQNSNQSRFSFARQEDLPNQEFDRVTSFSNIGHMANKYSDLQKFAENGDPYLDKLRNGFSSSILEDPDFSRSTQVPISSDRLSASRAHISAPPGFSLPSRPAPPGFSSQERMGQPFDALSGYHSFEGSSVLNNQYQAQQTGSIGDVEFIDPAIKMAVLKRGQPGTINNMGFDVRSTFNSPLSAPESDPRFQMLMQQSVSSHQNLMFPDSVANRFSSFDTYKNSPRFPEQSQINSLPQFGQNSVQQSNGMHMSNGHWNSWNEVQSGNGLGMAELLRNERLGYQKQFPSYEDLKLRMPSSGDIYNRAFGM